MGIKELHRLVKKDRASLIKQQARPVIINTRFMQVAQQLRDIGVTPVFVFDDNNNDDNDGEDVVSANGSS